MANEEKITILFDETQNERGKMNQNLKNFRDLLRKKGKYKVKSYDDFPITYEGIKDGKVIIFACPDGSKLKISEINELIKYVEEGGGILLLSHASGDRGLRTNFNQLIENFGIKVKNDEVSDHQHCFLEMDTLPLIQNLESHPITSDLSQVVFIAGCSLETSKNAKGVAFSDMAAIPPNSPVIACTEHGSGKIVVIGSYRIFSDYSIGLNTEDNQKLALNTINWLTETHKEKVEEEKEIEVTEVKKIEEEEVEKGILETIKEEITVIEKEEIREMEEASEELTPLTHTEEEATPPPAVETSEKIHEIEETPLIKPSEILSIVSEETQEEVKQPTETIPSEKVQTYPSPPPPQVEPDLPKPIIQESKILVELSSIKEELSKLRKEIHYFSRELLKILKKT